MGSRIRALREKRDWSQAKLAAMIPGVKQQSIDQLEQGKIRRPRFIYELARLFEVNEEWLRTGSGSPSPPKPQKGKTDFALMRGVTEAIETALRARGLEFEDERFACLMGTLYELMLIDTKPGRSRVRAVADSLLNYELAVTRQRGGDYRERPTVGRKAPKLQRVVGLGKR